jgi:hypothetical protein
MNKSRSLIAIGLGIVLVFWACLAVACFVLFALVPDPNPSRVGIEVSEATPAAQVIQAPPAEAERETGRIVEQATVPPRDLADLGRRLGSLPPSFTPATPPPSPAYQVGDTHTFWLHNVETNSFFTATATLQYATPHAYWWIESGYDVPEFKLARSAGNFEDKTYPTTRRIFGSEWSPGIDGDVHVYIFCGRVPGVGGYFSPPDEHPVAINPRSNQHEMFYINLDNAMPGDAYFDGVLAHEFQHMIHWAKDADEVTWVNEGLSELAAHLNGYDVGGSDDQYLLAPDTQLTAWSELEDSAPHYGAAYLFMSYVHDQYGDDAIRRLVDEPENGIASINALLAAIDPSGRQFEDLFADWTVALYLDDARLSGGRYGYSDVSIRQPRLSAEHAGGAADQRASVRQYGVDYVVLDGAGPVTVDISGSTVVSLVGNQVHSGSYQWWSNRADESDVRLTREFDLTGLEQATLEAWMWYELESDYDYAYVEVSADAGQTWTLLANDHTTTTNPSGNSYGPALTGVSGGGDARAAEGSGAGEPAWILETFDLSEYAGGPVLLRFEVITDEELHYRGLCLDGVAIPELGYADDAETDGGWQAEGFLRVTDEIPQQLLVQVILEGRDPRVERVELDEEQHGQIVIPGSGTGIKRAVLVITGTAPVTTTPAVYEYRIRPAQ